MNAIINNHTTLLHSEYNPQALDSYHTTMISEYGTFFERRVSFSSTWKRTPRFSPNSLKCLKLSIGEIKVEFLFILVEWFTDSK